MHQLERIKKKIPILEDYHDDQGHKTSRRRFQQECPNSHHHPNQQQLEKNIYKHGSFQHQY